MYVCWCGETDQTVVVACDGRELAEQTRRWSEWQEARANPNRSDQEAE